jgi:hypothetical protein
MSLLFRKSIIPFQNSLIHSWEFLNLNRIEPRKFKYDIDFGGISAPTERRLDFPVKNTKSGADFKKPE